MCRYLIIYGHHITQMQTHTHTLRVLQLVIILIGNYTEVSVEGVTPQFVKDSLGVGVGGLEESYHCTGPYSSKQHSHIYSNGCNLICFQPFLPPLSHILFIQVRATLTHSHSSCLLCCLGLCICVGAGQTVLQVIIN